MKKRQIITHFYNEELRLDPEKLECLGWEDRKSQFRRFQILTDYIDLNGKKVLDVGCGFGHLVEHLKDREIQAEYTGLDLLSSMVGSARERHGEHTFLEGDLFGETLFEGDSFHVLYCSGLFNLNTGNNFDFLLDAVETFLHLSTETVVFNLLHKDSPDKEDRFYYFHPDQVIREIEVRFSQIKSIQLVEHYLNNDFTLLLSQQEGPLCRKGN
ncbi:MAG: methyltransferase domain-containing protein [Spirochaetales bacterium]|nr:methyltransferase domain-containing protein [Spirochaetales bacterium]